MDSEAKRIKDELKKLPFKKRLSNFWYYYKFHIIIGVIVILILGASITQCVRQPDYDLKVSLCMTEPHQEEELLAITELLRAKCKDVDGDNEVNININPSFVDITQSAIDEVSMSVYVKIQGGLASNEFAGYIVDEAFKNYIINDCGYWEDGLVEITDIPEVRECITLKEGKRLYWITGYERGAKEGELNQFDNGKRIEDYFKK